MYFLGVDAGTSRMKAALMDIEGNQIDIVSKPVKVLFPFEDACEINMEDLWKVFCSLTHSLREKNSEIWNEIAGVGITGQGDGLWPVDKNGKPVRNAILWNDTRSKKLKIKNREAIDEICVKNSANLVYAGSVHILLRWLKEYEPESLQKISSVLHCKDWINFKLTGEIYTDYSDSSTAALNIYKKEYVPEILDAMEIPEYESLLPKPVSSTTVIGSITKAASSETGIKEGIPVIAGSIDVAAVALGTGVKEIGDVCTIVGTTLCNEMVLENHQIDFRKGLAVCHIIDGRNMSGQYTLSGTSTIDWVKGILFPELSFKELEDELSRVPLGSRGIIYHPYLYGERSPFRNPFACGGFYGLRAIHNKYDMTRAAYEGMVLSLYDCFQSLPPVVGSVRICGGGSVSDLLCQMISDCIGKEILRPKVDQLGISGITAALKVALNVVHDFSQASSAENTLFASHKDVHDKYLELYETFKDLRTGMESFWTKR